MIRKKQLSTGRGVVLDLTYRGPCSHQRQSKWLSIRMCSERKDPQVESVCFYISVAKPTMPTCVYVVWSVGTHLHVCVCMGIELCVSQYRALHHIVPDRQSVGLNTKQQEAPLHTVPIQPYRTLWHTHTRTHTLKNAHSAHTGTDNSSMFFFVFCFNNSG